MSVDLEVRPYDPGTGSYFMKHVNIESFSCEPVLGQDGMKPIGSRWNINGTAMMTAVEWQDFQNNLAKFNERLQYARIRLPSSPTQTLVDLTYQQSDIRGPYLKTTGTQVVGSTVMLVRWELTDQTSYCNLPIVGHTWTQRMSLDAAGKPTRTISGHLQCAMSATASGVTLPAWDSTTWASTAPWPDYFRSMVAPPMPGIGWRRESQEYGTNPQGTELVYQIVDKQYLHDLPDGVRVGDMEFSYERRADNAGIGLCSFSCDLEGSFGMETMTGTTGNRRLIEAAVMLSKTRIDASYANVLITRMRVTERGMLTNYAIRFEVDAQVYPSGDSQAIQPIAFMVGQKFSVTRTTQINVGAYGESTSTTQRIGFEPHWIGSALNAWRCSSSGTKVGGATVFTITNTAQSYGSVTVVVVSDKDGTDAMNSAFAGAYAASQYQPPNAELGGTEIVPHTASTTNATYDSGLVRLSPMYVSEPQLVFQTRKPSVQVTERVEIAKANIAPNKYLRPLPDGATLVTDDWNAAFGRYDAQGQRMFTGIYERTYALYDTGGTTTNGFYTQATPSGANVRAWEAPHGILLPSLSAIGTTASQDVAVSALGAASVTLPNAAYNVTNETFVT